MAPRHWIAPAAITLLALLAAPAALAGEYDRYSGTYAYAGDDAERQARHDAIDAVVQQMPRLFRAFAFKRIDKATPIPDQVVIEVAGGEITIGDAPGKGDTTPLGDEEGIVREGDEGADMTVTRTPVDGGIKHRAEQHNGFGQDLYRLADDGQTLKVEVTIGSKQLPGDITYELTYRRQ